ncbi:MAG TPA: helix-turn-helix domain-containing protein [Chryseosolibacter sp.]
MKNICILVPRGAAALSCIEGPYTLFTKANDFLENFGKPKLFNVQLVGITKDPQCYDRFFSVVPDKTIKDPLKADLIIIPAVNGEWKSVVDINREFFPWINTQYQNGSDVASLCVGAFLLAGTGLLKGKRCATHWLSADDFRKLFPDVNLVSEKIITEENGLYSSGGANSFWNLLLYLMEKYTDREMAILCSKYYQIEIDRDSQSPFIMFKGQRDHQDEDIKKAQEYIENNFRERITVDKLSSMFAMGRRSLERRFKKATSNTVTEYIQRVKIEAAKKSFELSRKNVDEIMDEVGYSDNKAFRSIFKRTTGLSPVEYKNRYNREAVQL